MAVGIFGAASSPDDPKDELANPPTATTPDAQVNQAGGWLDKVHTKLNKWEAKQPKHVKDRIQQARNESKPGRKK